MRMLRYRHGIVWLDLYCSFLFVKSSFCYLAKPRSYHLRFKNCRDDPHIRPSFGKAKANLGKLPATK
jgi:hypothetical protein